MVWTDERQADLERLAAEGLSASLIGARLGATRNAIIGRCFRTGVKLRGCSGRRVNPARPKTARIKAERKPRPERAPRQPRGRWKYGPAVVDEVRRLYGRDVTLRGISEATGVPAGYIPALVRDLPRRRDVHWSTSRKDEALKVEAVAATLAGESFRAAAERLGTCDSSITQWKRDPTILGAASALAASIKAEKAARLAAEAAEREAEAERVRAQVAAENAPVLAKMSPRHAAMMQMRVDGFSLQEVGDRFEITRERVRQIEARWRFAGLIVPGARELTEASKRYSFAKAHAAPFSPATPETVTA